MKCLVVIFCLAGTLCFAQTATVTGTALDASTDEPLPFANVYFNGTTLGTTTDQHGNFEIRGVAIPASYELIISYVGYESISLKVNLSEQLIPLRPIRLKPSKTTLDLVEVKGTRDEEWEKKMKRFTSIFLGTDKEAAKCRIVNPWVIDFRENKDARLLLATASQPIVVENEALGYRIRFTLLLFSSDAENYTISGKTFFEEMTAANTAQWTAWHNERERAYRNSKQYLFRSMLEKRITGEGFKLYSQIGNMDERSGFFFKNEWGKSVFDSDTLHMVSNGPQRDLYTLHLPKRLEVHYLGDKDRNSIYRDIPHPVSWIELKGETVVVNKYGFEMNTSNIVTVGRMNEIRLSRIVPSNYDPTQRNVNGASEEYAYLEEKIYVQTDKPYYYPGETIWLKGYIRYRTQSLRDSLSRTVYAEIIGGDKRVKISKMTEVTSGTFFNEFVLPDTLAPGNYFLRCYTTMNRNFGDQHLYIKNLPVLGTRQSVDPGTAMTSYDNGLLGIKSSKDTFGIRNKIELDLSPMTDSVRLDNASLSISVTDMKQVVPVNVNPAIPNELQFGDLMSFNLKYPLERGFSFRGNFQGNAKIKQAWLTILRLQPRQSIMAQLDNDGNFEVSGLNFYDSVKFAVFASGDHAGGNVRLLPRDTPTVYLPTIPKISVQESEVAQRPNYKTGDVTMLQEVTVEAKRVNNERPIPHRFGTPDRVVSGKDIMAMGQNNLFMGIQGKIPGLMVRQIMDDDHELRWFVYLRSTKNRIPDEVVITVNDNLMKGPAQEILTSIRVATVESVELIRYSPVLGNLGANGLLAVYTKPNDAVNEPGNSKNVMVYGYQHPAVFRSPDYSASSSDNLGTDIRSTVYWNPDVALDETGKAHVTFYAADLATRYRIVVEGITPDGTPIRAEKIIEIE